MTAEATRTETKQLLRTSFWYVLGYGLVSLAGFISFPIWTRLLTIEEYGVFNLINACIFFTTAITKFGLQKAAERFFYEFGLGKREADVSSYYSTLWTGSLTLSSSAVVIAVVVFNFLLPPFGDGQFSYLIHLALLIAIFEPLNSVMLSFLRVEKKAGFHAILNVYKKYGSLSIGMMFFVVFVWGLPGLFWARILIEASMAVVLTTRIVVQKKLAFRSFSKKFLVESVMFGMPLIPFELCQIFLNLGDRFLVQAFLDLKAVGLYSAGYTMVSTVQSLISVPVTMALPPLFLEMWEKQGKKKTEEFISFSLDCFLSIGVPSICALTFFGGDMLAVLASTKYADAKVIIPYLAAPLVLLGARTIFSSGLFIQKKTLVLMYLTVAASVINVVMNILLIPVWGISGAAIATLASSACLIAMFVIWSAKYIKLRVNVPNVARYILASTAMVVAMYQVDGGGFLLLLAKCLLGFLVYASALWLIDPRARRLLRKLSIRQLARMRPTRGQREE